MIDVDPLTQRLYAPLDLLLSAFLQFLATSYPLSTLQRTEVLSKRSVSTLRVQTRRLPDFEDTHHRNSSILAEDNCASSRKEDPKLDVMMGKTDSI